jgi:hypothetical protein
MNGVRSYLVLFIPLILAHNNFYTTEASIKCLITQAAASSSVLFQVIIKVLVEDIFSFADRYYLSVSISTPLLLKRDAAPFH